MRKTNALLVTLWALLVATSCLFLRSATSTESKIYREEEIEGVKTGR